jgi:thioredoxin 1
VGIVLIVGMLLTASVVLALGMITPTPTTCPIGKIIVVNKTVTAKATSKPTVSVLYFMENGCPYCEQQTPIIQDIAKNHNVTTINLTSDVLGPTAVKQYNVSTTPTTIIFKNGKESARFVTVTSEQTILDAMT